MLRTTRELVYAAVGNPATVVAVKSRVLPLSDYLPKGHVLLRFLASPINPSDINQVQGVYAVKPVWREDVDGTAVGGNEGVAEIVKVGEDVKSVQPGDWVLPAIAAFGKRLPFLLY